MKLEDALEIGKICGLETTAESVNNILFHASNLFFYKDITSELEELVFEAKAAGIEFHSCGSAMIDEKCYMCEKFNRLRKGDRE